MFVDKQIRHSISCRIHIDILTHTHARIDMFVQPNTLLHPRQNTYRYIDTHLCSSTYVWSTKYGISSSTEYLYRYIDTLVYSCSLLHMFVQTNTSLHQQQNIHSYIHTHLYTQTYNCLFQSCAHSHCLVTFSFSHTLSPSLSLHLSASGFLSLSASARACALSLFVCADFLVYSCVLTHVVQT